jgi:hypothetical protein
MPKRAVDRAVSDYLAVSRRAGMYATTDDYLRAESAAWRKLVVALRRVERRAVPA